MRNQAKKIEWVYGLLLIPIFSALLALNHFGFFFKAGVAGAGMLILYLLYQGQLSQKRDVWAIFIAFFFSIAGDWFLSNRHGEVSMFIAGIALFFVAHIGYLTFALMNGRLSRRYTILILSGFILFYIFVLFPGIDNPILKLASFCYLLISCFSLGGAIGMKDRYWFKRFYVFGIVLVLFSDTIIALREFTALKHLDWLVLPTYYLAQISITASLITRKIRGGF